MRRVSVVGTSGSGKTTVTAALSARLVVPHLELDGLRHQPGWVPLPDGEFVARVAADPAWATVDFVRLRSRREVRAFLDGLRTAAR
jgi:adenylate kinase family enzyme